MTISILIYHAVYKTPYIFDEVDGYIRKYRSKSVALFVPDEKYEKILQRNKYLINKDSNILDVYDRKVMKIKINSDNDLSLEKESIMCNVVIHIKSVLNAYDNNWAFQVFLKNVWIKNKLAEVICCCLLVAY